MRLPLTVIFFLLGLFTQGTVYAQIPPDSLDEQEKSLLTAGVKLSASYQLFIADSCAVRKDKACVEEALSKVDAYYLLFALEQTPQTLDSFLSKYNLDSAQAKAFKQRFIRTYYSKKTASYKRFQKQHAEDQAIREQYNQCSDSATCVRLKKQMRVQDSLHAGSLLRYVRKYGWPLPEQGGYYAGVLAVHDHTNHEVYIPAVTKALLSGKAEPSLLQWLLYYKTNLKDRGSYLKMLDTTRHQRFDVSELLSFRMPQNLPQIRDFLTEHCKVKLYLMFESFENSQYTSWDNKAHYLGNTDSAGHILAQFSNKMRVGSRAKLPENLWSIQWEATPQKKPKIILYITY